LPAFTNVTVARLGGSKCSIAAVSDDGLWLLMQTPSPVSICGSNTTACGYVTLSISNSVAVPDGVAAYNVTLACPPFCPGSYDASVAAPYAPYSPGVISLGSIPPRVSGGAPFQLPSPDIASIGIYYTLACSATGLFTDPTLSNACVNASDPASLNCAYGSGDACVRCPSGGLCPGGYRLRSRPGFWAAAESSEVVIPCSIPATARCIGWDASLGVTACGLGYRASSYLCGACAPGFYDPGDGTCASCPIISGAWEKYRGLLGLAAGIAAFVGLVAGALFVIVKTAGGTLAGLARRVVSLAVWAVMTVQTLALVARDASSSSLPDALRATYSFVSVLTLEVRAVGKHSLIVQREMLSLLYFCVIAVSLFWELQGIVLPPACTGVYAFASEVGVMSAAVAFWLFAVLIFAATFHPDPRPVHRGARLVGRGALTAALILYPAASTAAVSLLYCSQAGLSGRQLAALDAGSESSASSSSGAVSILLLSSNPFFVCWVSGGAHRPAGILAALTLAVHVAGLPISLLIWLVLDAGLQRARAVERATTASDAVTFRWCDVKARRRRSPPQPGLATTTPVITALPPRPIPRRLPPCRLVHQARGPRADADPLAAPGAPAAA
jgi:hypothetical protein